MVGRVPVFGQDHAVENVSPFLERVDEREDLVASGDG